MLGHNMVQSAGLDIEPGAVVLIEKQNPFDGNVVCASRNALGDDKITVNIDSIENHTIRGNKSMSAVFDAVSGNNKGNNRNVYKNIRVLTISDTEVIKHAELRKFSSACVKAIERNLNAGKPLAMISSVMIGDAETNTSKEGDVGFSNQRGNVKATRKSEAVTTRKDHKIGVKFSQMQLSILTEEMGINVNPKDIPLPIQVPVIF